MAPRISLALVLHNHQPVGNFGWVIEYVYERAYEPMIAALERHPRVRLGLHYSGTLIEWLRQNRPETLERVRALVARDQVEILGGAYYEPILVALPERDRHGQLVRMADEVERLFGRRPRGAWLAERVWEPSLPADLAGAGYSYTVLDDNHLRAASVKEDAMWGTYTTDDQGEILTIFGTEQGLRYRIPFREVDDLIGYLREHASEDGARLGMMGDDGEKFGAWPGTFEHCWGRTQWVERCFGALEANADWLTTVWPSDWLATRPPIGRIYIPASSYLEMTEWVLPPDEQTVFVELIQAAREQGRPEARFLRGGFWRNFQARYREVNDLHKQMLRVSRKVDRMPAGAEKSAALEHLYQGESNDCYWHGLFGGIYIVHMRMATLGHLIAAEDLADSWARREAAAPPAAAPTAPAPSPAPPVPSSDGIFLFDADLDGVAEALLASEGQSVVVDLAEGAGIGSWDLRASRVALAAVMRRRPEAYHERLRAHERVLAAGGAHPAHDGVVDSGEAGAPRTIHEIVTTKERGLSQRIVYDWHERRGGLVHLLPPWQRGLSAADLSAMRYVELGDFADQPFDIAEVEDTALLVRREGHLHVAGGGRRAFAVSKLLSLGGGRLDPWLELEVTLENLAGERVELELALEWGFNLMGGGGNPAAYYEWLQEVKDEGGTLPRRVTHDGSEELDLDRIAFGNEHAGVRVDAIASPGARVSWFPIETVSNSEAGFERIYQGSSLLFRWPVALEPTETSSRSVRFQVAQARDLAAQEMAGAAG